MSRRTTYSQALEAITAIRAASGGTGHDLSRLTENLNVLESYIGNGDKPDKPVFKIDVSATGDRAGQLATDHWSYIEGVLQAHDIDRAEYSGY